jgi:hypothetical protein
LKPKPKEKRNSGFKPSTIKEQEYFNMFSNSASINEKNFENSRGYFKDLQTLREEKEIAKNRYQNTPGQQIFH